MIVPVGGGGLASGIGIALRRAGVEAQLLGVQAALCAPFAEAIGEPGAGASTGAPVLSETTIADGSPSSGPVA